MSKNSKDSPILAPVNTPKSNWSQLNQNLSTALKTWDELSLSQNSQLSPDEEQLREIKKILKDLQSRINEFK